MINIGFIGLGHMGAPMAANLLKAGQNVFVYDINPKACALLGKAGAHVEKSVAELAKKVKIVFTMLQTTEQVESICLDAQGLFEHLPENALYIDCSSIDITACRSLHQKALEKNIRMLDAPVSGGVKGAEAGSLTLMVGGDALVFEAAQTVLQYLGKKIVHAGGPGNGQAAKICNNMLLGISMIAVSESFQLAEKLGLDPKVFFDIVSKASGQCWSVTEYCPAPNILPDVPANHAYEPGFAAAMMLKDLKLSQAAAEGIDLSTPMGALAKELYQAFIDKGHGDKDFSGVKYLE